MDKTISLVLVLALGLTAEVANADFIWGTPTNLGPTVNSSADDAAPDISADGLQLYFIDWEVFRPGGYGLSDIWVTTRETTEDDWGTPVNLGPTVNSSAREGAMSISADGLSLFFGSNRPGGHGGWDLWVTTRATTEDDWGTPMNLGSTVNSSYLDAMGSISADGLSLFFTSDRPGGLGSWDLWVTTRATKEDDWGTPVNLGPTVNSTAHDGLPDISADGLALFFSDYLSGPYRPGGFGISDSWVTTRPTTDDPWGTPVNLGPQVNTSAEDLGTSISADGSTLFFSSRRPGGYGSGDIWQVPIIPIVDFNGDGIVDIKDFSKLAQQWGQNERSVDAGPMPWGNGIVDIQDVAVLTEYWLKDFRLIAHWKLDETEGYTAHDSAGDHDALAVGPFWRPTDGIVNGALEFDGVDDYVSTPFVLNPADEAFSVFVWIKGGAAGQVVLSQIGAANWLLADAEGKLMTELKGTGRFAGPLYAETVITGGQWHRVGLTWDGSNRTLYVDDVEAAKDTQSSLTGSEGGLYIGASKDRAPGSFFSGLIDDVKIYNRAIAP